MPCNHLPARSSKPGSVLALPAAAAPNTVQPGGASGGVKLNGTYTVTGSGAQLAAG